METRLARYLHAKGKQYGLPISGTFELTPCCNFDCKMCYVHLTKQEQEQRGRELTAEQWIEIGEEAKKAGTVFLLLTGGEPLLRPDFMEIFRKLKQKGFFISINSNGLLLEGNLFKELCNDPPARINISLYGISNATYERQCGLPVYDRIIANIRALRAAGIDVKVTMSVTPANNEDLQAVYDKAKELGAHMQSTPYMFPPIRLHPEMYGQNFRLLPEDAGRLMADYEIANGTEKQIQRRFESLEDAPACDIDCTEGDGVHCRGGVTSFWIDWDGKMLPCGQMVEPAADVLRYGFSEAWERTKQATAKIRLPLECTQCSIRDICHVCAAMCYCETGSFGKKPEYICKMRQSYLERIKQLKDERYGGK